ncbi:hypothetical protein T484DRAFT_1930819 [Baffinella frigidus]|nr:hypothetical protein T484DRAFT_1930819 [Cryptophyta sp. CCMP2293]
MGSAFLASLGVSTPRPAARLRRLRPSRGRSLPVRLEMLDSHLLCHPSITVQVLLDPHLRRTALRCVLLPDHLFSLDDFCSALHILLLFVLLGPHLIRIALRCVFLPDHPFSLDNFGCALENFWSLLLVLFPGQLLFQDLLRLLAALRLHLRHHRRVLAPRSEPDFCIVLNLLIDSRRSKMVRPSTVLRVLPIVGGRAVVCVGHLGYRWLDRSSCLVVDDLFGGIGFSHPAKCARLLRIALRCILLPEYAYRRTLG